MAAIISGDNLGLYSQSLANNTPNNNSVIGQGGTQVFVNGSTGNLIIQQQDAFLSSASVDIAAVRTYNSLGQYDDDNGDNWRIGFNRYLHSQSGTINQSGSTITKTFGDGTEIVFTYDQGLGFYISTDGSGVHDTLEYSGGNWIWRSDSGAVTETYNSAGQLTEIDDRDGNTLTFGYNGSGLLDNVTDAEDQTTFFDYTGNNLTQIRTYSAGQTQTLTTYQYDSQNRLSQVHVDLTPENSADNQVFTTLYTYDGTSKRVSSISHSDGTEISIIYVQVNGKYVVDTLIDGEGRITSFEYNFNAGGNNTVYNANGNVLVDEETSTGTQDYALNGGQLEDQVAGTADYGLDDTSLLTTETQVNNDDYSLDEDQLQAPATWTVDYSLDMAQLSTTEEVQQSDDYDLNADALSQDPLTQDYALDGSALTAVAGSTTIIDGSSFHVNTTVGYDQKNIDQAVLADGSVILVWESNEDWSANANIMGQRIDAQGNKIGGELLINEYLVDGSGNNTRQRNASVAALDNGGFVVAWESLNQDNDHYGVYARVYDSNGNAVAGEFAVNTTTAGVQEGATIAATDNGGFVIAWHSNNIDGGGTAVVMRTFDAAGNALTAEQQVNTYTISDQKKPVIRTLADGRHVIIWGSNGQDGNGYGIFGRIYDGVNPAGGEFQVNTATYYSQQHQSVAALSDGGFIVTWASYGVDGYNSAVLSQRYDSNGNTVGGNEIVNTYTSGDQDSPSVAGLNDGGYVIAWRSFHYGVDNGYEVMYRRYDADGNPLGDQVMFPDDTSGDQKSPVVSALQDGGFMIAYEENWAMPGVYDPYQGVFAKNFNGAGGANETYYEVQAGDTWETIADTLYGSTGVADELQSALGNPVLAAGLQLTGLPASLTDDLGLSAPYYQVQSGDSWSSIAMVLYGTTDVADELEAALGSPALVMGTQLTGFPATLTNTYTVQVNVPPYYEVQASDSWADVAALLYGTADVVDELQFALGTSALNTGDHLTGFPASLTDDDVVVGGDPYYQVQSGDSWSSIATVLYGSADVADELETALGSPALVIGTQLTGFPATLTHTYQTQITVPAYYEVQASDSWADVAALLYGTADVVDELQAALGTSALNTGDHLTGFPATLTDDDVLVNVTPFYQVQSGDSWASIAMALYGSANVADELETALGSPELVMGTQLTGFPATLTDSFPVTVSVTPYYEVQAGDTWESIAVTIYGNADAADELRDAMGNPALTAGLQLQVPASLNESTAAFTGGTTHITDANGGVTTLEYDDEGKLERLQTQDVNGVRAEMQYAYDADDNLVQVTNELGNITAYEYDEFGNRILERDAIGNTVTRIYNTDNQIVNETIYLVSDPDGAGAAQPSEPRTTRYAYDSEGHLRFTINAAGEVTEYRYNGLGQRVVTLQYTQSTYDVSGLSAETVLTESQLNTWFNGIDQSQGLRTDYSYDFRGNLSVEIHYARLDSNSQGIADGSQSVTRYLYDQSGRLISRVDPRGELTADPNDYTTNYVYDGLGRLLLATNSLGQNTVSSYDDLNQRVLMTAANGLLTTSVYNAAGELVSVSESYNNNILSQTNYFYNDLGLLAYSESPAGERSYSLYNERGEQIANIDHSGSVTEIIYDDAGQALRYISYANELSVAQIASLVNVDGSPADIDFGSIRPSMHVDDRIKHNVYDDAGRLTYVVDAEGYVAKSIYDGASQIVETIAYANAINVASLGNNPDVALVQGLIASNVAEDRHQYSVYDKAGRVVFQIDAENYVTETVYDEAGQMIEVIAYANTITLPATINEASVRAAISIGGDDQHSYVTYDAMGRQVYSVNAEGYITENRYDVAGNIVETVAYAETVPSAVAKTTSDLQNWIAGNTNVSLARTEQFEYDSEGRVTRSVNVEGSATDIAYDEVGRVIETTSGIGISGAVDGSGERTIMVRYDVQGRVIAELTAEGADQITGGMTQAQIDAIWNQYAVTHTYDTAGRRISTTDQNGNTSWLFYNAEGLPVLTVNAAGEVSETIFNRFNDVQSEIIYANRVSTSGLTGGSIPAALASWLNAERGNAENSKTEFTYNNRGLLKSIVDALGNTAYKQYNAFGEVTQFSVPTQNGTAATVYSYNQRGELLQSIQDAGGLNIIIATEYDAFGRVIQTTDANGQSTAYEYDKLGREIVITDALNNDIITSYDAFNRVITEQDRNGNITTYQYDDSARTITTTYSGIAQTVVRRNRHGEQVSVIDGENNETVYQYNKNGQLTKVTDAENNELVSNYDEAGLLISKEAPNGTITEYQYDAANRLFQVTRDKNGLNLTTTTEYDAKGQMILSTAPDGTQTRTVYDAKGQVLQVIRDYTANATDGLNVVTEYAYDKKGNQVAVIEGKGTAEERVTHYLYDNADRLTHVIDAEGYVTQTLYDNNGNVVLTKRYADFQIDPAGLSNNFNAASLNLTSSEDDVYLHSVYDKLNRLVFDVNAEGYVTQRVYDDNGNVIQTRRYAGVQLDTSSLPVGATEADLGLITSTEDRVTHSVYDSLNRLTHVVDAEGYVTESAYDDNGNVVMTRRYADVKLNSNTMTAGVTVAGLGLITSVNDALVHTIYDGVNRATHVVDAEGYVTQRVYDDNGNVIQTRRYADVKLNPVSLPVEATVFDLNLSQSSLDSVSVYVYDALDRAVFTVNALGYMTENVYDSLGRVVGSIAYANATVTPLNTLMTQTPSQVKASMQASADDRTQYSAYDALGRRLFSIDSLGYVTEQRYNALGQVTDSFMYGDALSTASLSMGMSADVISALLVASNQTDVRQTQSQYDGLGNLVWKQDALNNIETYTYDAFSNQLSYTNANNDTWVYAYDALGRVVEETTPVVSVTRLSALLQETTTQEAVVTRMAYDAFGNLTNRTEAYGTVDARTTSYEYDKLNRQTHTIHAPVGVYDKAAALDATNREETSKILDSRVAYDAFGNAVAGVDVSGNASYKVYDSLHRLVYDIDAGGYVTEYQYDAFGNQTSLIRYDDTVFFAGHIAGEPLSQSEISILIGETYEMFSREIQTIYDALGRAVETIEPQVFNFDSRVSGAGEAYTASPRSQNVYNGFGELIEQSVLRNGVSNEWATTYFYYDDKGQRIGSVDPAGYVSEWEYDLNGNVTVMREFSEALSGSWNSSSDFAALVAAIPKHPAGDNSPYGQDRIVRNTYDALGRQISRTLEQVQYSELSAITGQANEQIGDLITDYFYDAVGNLIMTRDAQGYETHTYYDALGQVIAVTEPAREIEGGATVTPITTFEHDVFGKVVQQTRHANGTSSADLYSFNAPVADAANDQTSYTRYDSFGRAIEQTDAESGVVFYSYDEAGRVMKTWQPISNSITENDQTAISHFRYDELGRQTDTIEVLGGDQSLTTAEYNAFGEIIAKDINGTQQFFDYDDMGRLWRTNSEGGVDKVSLYDLQGNKTADIQSSYYDLSAFGYEPASVNNLTQGIQRTETTYDVLGRVVNQVSPGFEQETTADYIPTAFRLQFDESLGRNILVWDKGEVVGSIPALKVGIVGGGLSTVSVQTDRQDVFWVDLNGYVTDLYNYELSYTRQGDAVAHAKISGVLQLMGDSSVGSQNVVAIGELPVFDWSFDAGYEGGEFGDPTPRSLQLNWSSLEGWGLGDVRVDINYSEYVDGGEFGGYALTPQTFSQTFTSATAIDGVVIETPDVPEPGLIDGINILKNVNGTWVPVWTDAQNGSTIPERLLLRGNTSGLTQINVTTETGGNVGNYNATHIGGGVYTVDISGLATGSYRFTPIGTSSSIAGSFEARDDFAQGVVQVRESNFSINMLPESGTPYIWTPDQFGAPIPQTEGGEFPVYNTNPYYWGEGPQGPGYYADWDVWIDGGEFNEDYLQQGYRFSLDPFGDPQEAVDGGEFFEDIPAGWTWHTGQTPERIGGHWGNASGTNQIELSWNDMNYFGGGDVRVEVSYTGTRYLFVDPATKTIDVQESRQYLTVGYESGQGDWVPDEYGTSIPQTEGGEFPVYTQNPYYWANGAQGPGYYADWDIWVDGGEFGEDTLTQGYRFSLDPFGDPQEAIDGGEFGTDIPAGWTWYTGQPPARIGGYYSQADDPNINLSWNDLNAWGAGDVKVRVDYDGGDLVDIDPNQNTMPVRESTRSINTGYTAQTQTTINDQYQVNTYYYGPDGGEFGDLHTGSNPYYYAASGPNGAGYYADWDEQVWIDGGEFQPGYWQTNEQYLYSANSPIGEGYTLYSGNNPTRTGSYVQTSGSNQINLSWNNLDAWGGGNIRVEVTYGYRSSWGGSVQTGTTTRTYSSGAVNTGINLTSFDQSLVSLTSFQSVNVWKTVNGQEILVHQAGGDQTARSLELSSLPSNTATLQVEYRPLGSGGNYTTVNATKMADGWFRLDSSGIGNGLYEYELTAFTSGGGEISLVNADKYGTFEIQQGASSLAAKSNTAPPPLYADISSIYQNTYTANNARTGVFIDGFGSSTDAITNIKDVWVWKVVNGQDVLVYHTSGNSESRYAFEINDLPTNVDSLAVRYRELGSTGGFTQISAEQRGPGWFGFDTNGIPVGRYEYELIATSGGSAVDLGSNNQTGVFEVERGGASLAAASVLAPSPVAQNFDTTVSKVYNATDARFGVDFTDFTADTAMISNSEVKVYKQLNGEFVLIHTALTDSDVHALEIMNLPGNVATLEVHYRPEGSNDPYDQRFATPRGTGWFTMNDSDLPNGYYEYELVARDSVGTVVPLLDQDKYGVFRLIRSSATLGSTVVATPDPKLSQDVGNPAAPETETITITQSQQTDRWGNVISITDARGYTTDIEYNYLNKETEVVQPQVTAVDENGNDQVINPTTRMYYDEVGNIISKEQDMEDGGIQRNNRQYNSAGNLIAEYDSSNTVKQFSYDGFGRQVTEDKGDGRLINTVYDRKDRVVQQYRGNESVVYAYNELDQRISQTNAMNESIYYDYDTRGNVVWMQQPGSQVTTYDYDLNGNKILEINANNHQMTWDYDGYGRVLARSDLGGRDYQYNYDTLTKRLESEVQLNVGVGKNISYSYYDNGMLKSIVDNTLNSETTYKYDANGNRISEYFRLQNDIYQNANMTYDALNRLTEIWDTRYTATYSYDAVGNRRHTHTDYYDNSNQLQQKDYWYKYDGANRITLAQGELIGGNIQATQEQGTELGYDGAGNRAMARFYDGGQWVDETYLYNNEARLETTLRDGNTYTWRGYDDAGRQTEYRRFDNSGGLKDVKVSQYNSNGWLQTETTYASLSMSNSDRISQTRFASYDNMGNVLTYESEVFGHGGSLAYVNTLTKTYDRYDSYKESSVQGGSNYFERGNTQTFYDVNGNVLRVEDFQDSTRDRFFVTNTMGQILQKQENGEYQYYYYANGQAMGTSGMNGGQEVVDFDYNYTPVSDQFPSSTPSNYVVGEGDTLQSIAAAVYGDAQLWYLIADANGLRAGETLQVGQSLTIPNTITNIHNNSDTFKPYNAGEIIGDTTPTLPNPPPPAIDDGCGALGTIIMVVVSVVVAIYMPSLLPEVGKFWGAVIGAAAGSVASQAVGIAIGAQEKFDWGAVALAAVSAGVTQGIGGKVFNKVATVTGSTTAASAAQAMVSSAVNQGIEVAVGRRESFDWKSVAISGIAAGINAGIDDKLGLNNQPNLDAQDFSWGRVASESMHGIRRGIVHNTVDIAVRGKGKLDVSNIAADAFGNALGTAIGQHMLLDMHESRMAALVGDQRAHEMRQEGVLSNREKREYAFDAVANLEPTFKIDPSRSFHMENGQLVDANGNPANLPLMLADAGTNAFGVKVSPYGKGITRTDIPGEAPYFGVGRAPLTAEERAYRDADRARVDEVISDPAYQKEQAIKRTEAYMREVDAAELKQAVLEQEFTGALGWIYDAMYVASAGQLTEEQYLFYMNEVAQVSVTAEASIKINKYESIKLKYDLLANEGSIDLSAISKGDGSFKGNVTLDSDLNLKLGVTGNVGGIKVDGTVDAEGNISLAVNGQYSKDKRPMFVIPGIEGALDPDNLPEGMELIQTKEGAAKLTYKIPGTADSQDVVGPNDGYKPLKHEDNAFVKALKETGNRLSPFKQLGKVNSFIKGIKPVTNTINFLEHGDVRYERKFGNKESVISGKVNVGFNIKEPIEFVANYGNKLLGMMLINTVIDNVPEKYNNNNIITPGLENPKYQYDPRN